MPPAATRRTDATVGSGMVAANAWSAAGNGAGLAKFAVDSVRLANSQLSVDDLISGRSISNDSMNGSSRCA